MENKNSKYIKYAIGEIILVMIGILLALQVNNWNEKRKLSNTIESLLTVFEDELEANIEEAAELVRRGYYRDSISTRFINNKITREDLWKDPDMFLEFNTSTRDFVDDNLEALLDLEKELPRKYIALVPELKELKARIESQRTWEKAVVEISMARKMEQAVQLPSWYLTDSISIEKNINYCLTDPIFKSKVVHYNEYYLDENTWDASLIRTSAVALLWKIKNIRGDVSSSLDDLLRSFRLKPFQVLGCEALPVEPIDKTNFRVNYILYNNTDVEVYFNFLNMEGEIQNRRTLSLPPKSFRLRPATLSEEWLIQVVENNTCKNIYRRLKQDYLIIN
jgi:hypothetical protein